MLHNAQNVSEVPHGVLYPEAHTWARGNRFQKNMATMRRTITISSNYCLSGKRNRVSVERAHERVPDVLGQPRYVSVSPS
jgi:hypothetical protein